ncbi:MAG: methyltransferase domain-containing protein [Pseudomonadota bacterium]
MTIENSEDIAHVGVTDPVDPPALERSSGPAESAPEGSVRPDPPNSVIEIAPPTGTHDSTPPLSRKLAPPPKPKRDSGAASAPPTAPPSGRPPGEAPDLVASANALKAPIAPTISFSADGEPTLDDPALPVPDPLPAATAPAVAPLSQPPPLRRRSNPSIPDGGDANASLSRRTPSDPALPGGDAAAAQAIANALRPIASPPRPLSDSPGPRLRSDSSPSVPDAAEPPALVSSAPAVAPPSSSAIFAMRIIAVGDSVRAPAVQEPATDIDPDAVPPNASRLGTGVRRSSRPVAAAPAAAAPVALPPAAAVPADLGPAIELDVPIDVELPAAVAEAPELDRLALLDAAAAALEAPSSPAASAPTASSPAASAPAASTIPLEARRPPAPPPPVELSDDEFSAEAIAKKIAAAEALEAAAEAVRAARAAGALAAEGAQPAEVAPAAEDAPAAEAVQAEELGREDAISMPPEDMAPDQTELDAKADAAKPPPPPKRAPGTPPSAPPGVESAPAAPSAPLRDTPTPDLAAAKAAQRSKTRQPWWEDLFNEDFMRASSRVSDEHIRREVTFIEESLGVAAGGVVLDLGCGAGHHAVEFASRGYGVVGYDLSLYQLALAADVAQERSQKINFLQGDMREMAFEEMFDGVFCWNTTFGYFEEDKNLAVAQRVFKALRPGGMFLIDVLNRDFAAASAPCTVWYEGDSCVCMDDMSVDYISSRLRVKRSIILDDGRTKESLFSLRLYSLHELGKLLHEVGFRVTEASGHPATPGVFFGPNSPRIIMLAQRP